MDHRQCDGSETVMSYPIPKLEDRIRVHRNIYALRSKMNWSIRFLARKLHIQVVTVESHECGDTYPKLVQLIQYADLFNVTLDELVFGEFD